MNDPCELCENLCALREKQIIDAAPIFLLSLHCLKRSDSENRESGDPQGNSGAAPAAVNLAPLMRSITDKKPLDS